MGGKQGGGHRPVSVRSLARRWGAGYRAGMTPPREPSYAGHRFPPEVIGHAVWLYFRFPLGLRMVEEMLAARGITVSHETVRQWGLKFGQAFANEIRRRLPRPVTSGTWTRSRSGLPARSTGC